MKRILISAGPTREPIDQVRFIGNRSSGTTGLAIAHAGAAAGHQVTLLLGPGVDDSKLDTAISVYRFGSTAELKQLLEAHWSGHDTLIMAAAVADYRPTVVAEGKIRRKSDQPLTITLEPTPDLAALMGQRKRDDQRLIAFALETQDQLIDRAQAKLIAKHADAIVANPLGTMESHDITATWIQAGAAPLKLSRMSKQAFGKWLIERIAQSL